jgi:FMN phosphatase YigB (HAD superfamily)
MVMTEFVFLFDVDNTLLENDRVKADLAARIERFVGPALGAHFWTLYEEVRQECDYVDFPRTLERFRAAFPEERKFPSLAALLLCYPYENSVFPGALDAIAHLKTLGTVAIVSDGDPVFQPAKIARAGLAAAVDDNVLIYAHKEAHLDEVAQRFPGERYILVDDKPRILAAAKGQLGARLVTLHVCQGRYAHAAEHHAYPAADLTVDAIAGLQGFTAQDFRLVEAPHG